MALLVEIHVPLADDPSEAPEWIDDVGDYLIDLEEELGLEEFDDGEQLGDHYVFFIAGANERTLLRAASRVATRKGVPRGAFALVTDTNAPEVGRGRRVRLPV